MLVLTYAVELISAAEDSAVGAAEQDRHLEGLEGVEEVGRHHQLFSLRNYFPSSNHCC